MAGSAAPWQLPALYCSVVAVFVVVLTVTVVVVVDVSVVDVSVAVVSVAVVAVVVVGHPWSTTSPACTLSNVVSNTSITSSHSVFKVVIKPSRHEKNRPDSCLSLFAASVQLPPA